MTWLSEAFSLAGRLDDARTLTAQALEMYRQNEERGHEAWALLLCGNIATQYQPIDAKQAETSYRQALVLAEALGMRPLQAHCYRGLGTLYRTLGRRQQARAALAMAVELYRAMEMTFWLPQTEAALTQAKIATP